MKILIDTHVFLWYVSADCKLPDAYRDALQDPENAIFLSVASIWEIVIKQQIGKLSLPSPAADYVCRNREAHGILTLTIEEADAVVLAGLPPLHRDAFDRMIVAQATRNSFAVATVDQAFIAYGVTCLPTV